MPILKAPLFSLKATGRLGKFLTLAKRQGRNIIERRPIPTDAKSPSQLFSRLMFNKCIDLWHLLSDAERQEWESAARPKHMTGYAWYISQCLRPNPGIYLPLIGGTMTGDIDMGKNRLLKLPLPTDAQEAASKAYVDALAPGLHAATHEDGGADEIDVGGLAGLLVEDQHIIDAEAVSAMGAKGDANPLHHDRYTDAEALASAEAKFDDHSARHENGGADEIDVAGLSGLLAEDQHIIDAEAVSAMGAKANANPLHHDRYTTAQAVAAAKTVKLDDFATPDDNTDLNASTSRHGLLKKLSNSAIEFLNGLGNWVEIVAGPTIATGTYTGDNANDRQIATGFKCSLVFNCHEDALLRARFAYPNTTLEIAGGARKTDLLLHASDGFVVDRTQQNENLKVYDYWAISE